MVEHIGDRVVSLVDNSKFQLMELNIGKRKESKGRIKEEPLEESSACSVCKDNARGVYFGARVCLPCKSFFIRCTKDGGSKFMCQASGDCDISKINRLRCQACRFKACLRVGMCRKEKPELIQPSQGQELCRVCADIANGIHFGVLTCEGCKKFFRRGLLESDSYSCKFSSNCLINPRNRNICRYCRYQRCIEAGMSRQAIKMGRPKKSESSTNQENYTILSASPKGTASKTPSADSVSPGMATKKLTPSFDSVSEVQTGEAESFPTQPTNLEFIPTPRETEKVEFSCGKLENIGNKSGSNKITSCNNGTVSAPSDINVANIGLERAMKRFTSVTVTSCFQTRSSTSVSSSHAAGSTETNASFFHNFNSSVPSPVLFGDKAVVQSAEGIAMVDAQRHLVPVPNVLEDISQEEMDSLLESLQAHDNKRQHQGDEHTGQQNTNKIRKTEDLNFQQCMLPSTESSSCRIANSLSQVTSYDSLNMVTNSETFQEPSFSLPRTSWMSNSRSLESNGAQLNSQNLHIADKSGFSFPSSHFLGCGPARVLPHSQGNVGDVFQGGFRAAKCVLPMHIDTVCTCFKMTGNNSLNCPNGNFFMEVW